MLYEDKLEFDSDELGLQVFDWEDVKQVRGHHIFNAPFPKPGQKPYIVQQFGELIKRHPDTTVIWAHVGLGRVVRPVEQQIGIVERALQNPELKNLHFDISWDETAKYIVKTPASIKNAATLINKYPDRFLFGTDEVSPSSQEGYLKVYWIQEPLLSELTDEAREKLLKGNYERLFNAANRKVRAWEEANKGALHAEPVAPTPISGYRYDRDPAAEPSTSN